MSILLALACQAEDIRSDTAVPAYVPIVVSGTTMADEAGRADIELPWDAPWQVECCHVTEDGTPDPNGTCVPPEWWAREGATNPVVSIKCPIDRPAVRWSYLL